jgi:hypothetical protein
MESDGVYFDEIVKEMIKEQMAELKKQDVSDTSATS